MNEWPHVAQPENVSESEVSLESRETLRQLREFVDQGYLLHGSKRPSEQVEPRQAHDTNKDRVIGQQNAVYATRHIEIPLFMALKEMKDKELGSMKSGYSGINGQFQMYGDNTTLSPGYVYVLPPDTFETIADEEGNEELISRVPVMPIVVFKVEPDILKLFDNIALDLK